MIVGSLAFLQKVEYIKTSGWGMEGESTTCVQFKSYDGVREALVEIEPLVKNSKLTTAKVLLDCDPNVAPQPNE